jgi:hypothetical protein
VPHQEVHRALDDHVTAGLDLAPAFAPVVSRILDDQDLDRRLEINGLCLHLVGVLDGKGRVGVALTGWIQDKASWISSQCKGHELELQLGKIQQNMDCAHHCPRTDAKCIVAASGAQMLKLVVTDGGNGWGTWGNARLQ